MWKTATLSDVCTIISGNSIPAKEKEEEYTNLIEGMPYVATKDVGFDRVINYDNGVRIPFENDKKFKLSHKNSTLVCAEGGSAGRKIAFSERDCFFVNKLFSIASKSDLDAKFIYYYALSEQFQSQFKSSLHGLIGGVSLKKIKNFNISYPSKAEQQRIVAKLDAAFAEIDTAFAAAEKNAENAEALYVAYAKEIFFNSSNSVQLKEVATVSMGQSPKGDSYNDEGIGYPLVNGPVEFEADAFGLSKNIKFTTSPTKFCEKGDVLLCVRGSTTGRMNIASDKVCIGRGVAAIRATHNQRWINFFVQSSRNYIYSLGTGATFPNVSSKSLENILINYPPVEEQNVLLDKLEIVYKKVGFHKSINQKNKSNLIALKSALLGTELTNMSEAA